MTRWLQAAKTALGGSDQTDKTDKTSGQLDQQIRSPARETAIPTASNRVLSVLSVWSGGGKADFGNGEGTQSSPFLHDEESLRMEFEERAAILEFDAGLARREAERRARLEIYGSDAKEESQ